MIMTFYSSKINQFKYEGTLSYYPKSFIFKCTYVFSYMSLKKSQFYESLKCLYDLFASHKVA